VIIRSGPHTVNGLEFLQGLDDLDRESRRKLIARVLNTKQISIPTVIDTVDADVERSYAAWPERLFIVDTQGQISYDAGWGMPGGWNRVELENQLNRQSQ